MISRKNYSPSILFVALLIGCKAPTYEYSSKQSGAKKNFTIDEIIFEEVDGNSETVFDFKKNKSFSRTKKSKSTNGHFGQNIIKCSNADYSCIDGDISISLPRDTNIVSWNYNANRCLKKSWLENSILVTCISNFGNRKSYAYISGKGDIIAFGNSSNDIKSEYRAPKGSGIPFGSWSELRLHVQ